jgi:hypothetical protein
VLVREAGAAGASWPLLETGSWKLEAHMKIDIVNSNNDKVGDLELNDALFGGRVKSGLIWE